MRHAQPSATTLSLVVMIYIVGLFWGSTQGMPGVAPRVFAAAPAQAAQLATSDGFVAASTAYAAEIFSSPEYGPTSFTIPAGQRMVVEHISGWCYRAYFIGFQVILNGQSFTHFINFNAVGGVFNGMTKFYADGTVSAVSPGQAGGCGATVSGYLVSH